MPLPPSRGRDGRRSGRARRGRIVQRREQVDRLLLRDRLDVEFVSGGPDPGGVGAPSAMEESVDGGEIPAARGTKIEVGRGERCDVAPPQPPRLVGAVVIAELVGELVVGRLCREQRDVAAGGIDHDGRPPTGPFINGDRHRMQRRWRSAHPQPSSWRRSSSMPAAWAISWITVTNTSSSRCSMSSHASHRASR